MKFSSYLRPIATTFLTPNMPAVASLTFRSKTCTPRKLLSVGEMSLRKMPCYMNPSDLLTKPKGNGPMADPSTPNESAKP